MSRRGPKRVDALERIGGAGRLTSREATEVLGLSTQQRRGDAVRRLRCAVASS